MAFKLADLLFRISADTKKFDRGMATSKKRVGGMTKAVSQFKNMLIGAFSIRIVAGFFKKIIELNKTFEKTMSGVRAISGATGEEFKRLEASAKQLGSTTSRTASQVAELQTEYAKLGFTTGEILAASAATIQLSEATGENLAQAAESAGAAIRAFGLEATQTQMVVDIMAASFTSSALNLDRWTESMGYVAPIARAAGRSIQLTAAALSIMADAGIHGSRAGTALKRIFEETAESGKPFAATLKDLAKKGITLANAEDEVGRRAMAALLILTNNIGKLEELKTAYDNAAGSAQTMADIQMDNLEGSMLRMTSAIEGLVLQAKQANTALKKTIDFFVDLLNVQALMVKKGYTVFDLMNPKKRELLALEQAFDKTLDRWVSNAIITEDKIAGMRSKIWNEYGQKAAILWHEMGQAHYEAYIKGQEKVAAKAAAAARVTAALMAISKAGAPKTRISTITPSIMPGGELNIGLANMADAFAANNDALRTATEEYSAIMDSVMYVNMIIEKSFVDMATTLGETLGDMITGLTGFEKSGDKILKGITDFASQFGQLLVAIGVAEMMFITQPFNWPGLIAAGIALIALSQVAKNLIANPTGGGGGGAGGGQSAGSYRAQTPTANMVGVLKGEDIYFSNQRTSDRFGRIGVG